MASIATRVDGQRPPELSAKDQRGLEDLWHVYDSAYDEITRESERALADDPEFGPLMRTIPRQVMEEQGRRSHELLRRAIVESDWHPYLADLHEQGAGYVRMGISFVSWFRALSIVRPLLLERLRTAFGTDPDRLLRAVEAMDKWFDIAMSVIGDSYLTTKEETILEQQEAIRELSTPVLTLMDGLLLLPVVGVLDSHRAKQMTDHLLQAIHRHRAKVVVIDITGVAAVDSMVANHLVQAVEAAGLLGAAAIVTGVSAEVAQTVVKLGVDLSMLRTVADLQGGVAEAARLVGYRLVRTERGAD